MTSGRVCTDEYARRVNEAMGLLEEGFQSGEVARELARRHGVSVRQGWRYVREAAERPQPLEIPEPKVVFTVKLPQSLARRIRAEANSRGQTLSSLVTESLEAVLQRLQHGRRGDGQGD